LNWKESSLGEVAEPNGTTFLVEDFSLTNLRVAPSAPDFRASPVFFVPFCGVSLSEVKIFARKNDVFDEKSGE